MITVGSLTRDAAAAIFPFLAANFAGRRRAIKEFTHRSPDFVFWISPEGRLYDARDSHRRNPPPGFDHIHDDEPDYGGFLRGRIASSGTAQLVVVYCRAEALSEPGPQVDQLARGIARLPVPLRQDALVVSDNGDLYGTVDDIALRVRP